MLVRMNISVVKIIILFRPVIQIVMFSDTHTDKTWKNLTNI